MRTVPCRRLMSWVRRAFLRVSFVCLLFRYFTPDVCAVPCSGLERARWKCEVFEQCLKILLVNVPRLPSLFAERRFSDCLNLNLCSALMEVSSGCSIQLHPKYDR